MAIELFKSAQTGLIFRPLDFNTNMEKIETAINELLLTSGVAESDELAALVAKDAELLALADLDTELTALAAKNTELTSLAAKDTELLAIETANAAGKMFGAYSNTVAVVKTDASAENLLDAVDVDRTFIAMITVDETFDSGDGAATIVKLGDGVTEDQYLSKNTGTAAETVMISGILLANKDLVITPTAATGTTGAGGVTITVIAAQQTLPV